MNDLRAYGRFVAAVLVSTALGRSGSCSASRAATDAPPATWADAPRTDPPPLASSDASADAE
jgi:hypothetical protein